MKTLHPKAHLAVMIAGDLLVLILVTLYGFATHGELYSAGTRMLTTFVPLALAWSMVAPFLFVYDLNKMANSRALWRPFYAMILAAPLAALVRAFMLGNMPIVPIFVVVLGGISALAILAWRALHWFIFLRRNLSHE